MKSLLNIIILIFLFSFLDTFAFQKNPTPPDSEILNKVNVFLGTSGDHGQLSPAASHPFSMMSIGPQTNPDIHTGYDHYAKNFEGFTHTRIEGVGCKGSGGNILITPVLKNEPSLVKSGEKAYPGYYQAHFKNGIKASMTAGLNFGIERYDFANQQGTLEIDLSYAFENRFVAEEHHIENNRVTGFIDTRTTCSAGIYRIYFAIIVKNSEALVESNEHSIKATSINSSKPLEVLIGFSSVDKTYALQKLEAISFEKLRTETADDWDSLLNRIVVKGTDEREHLFYSLLYRSLQAPYLISEKDGNYRAIDGSQQHANFEVYNGWAIWDNYREQLPLLSLFYPEKFKNIAKSIANLYPYGKKNWATMHEPSPTVRTEHALVVLLDAYKKGYTINFESIKDSIIAEADRLDYSAPDKALESSYDNWAVSQILDITGDAMQSRKYKTKALEYKNYWNKDFADLSKNDIDRMQARGLYQGTIWQYRWLSHLILTD